MWNGTGLRNEQSAVAELGKGAQSRSLLCTTIPTFGTFIHRVRCEYLLDENEEEIRRREKKRRRRRRKTKTEIEWAQVDVHLLLLLREKLQLQVDREDHAKPSCSPDADHHFIA